MSSKYAILRMERVYALKGTLSIGNMEHIYSSRMVGDPLIAVASILRRSKTSFSCRCLLSDVSTACMRQCESEGTYRT